MATGWDAFITYAHAASGDTAVALQRGLERFARPWHRRRMIRVFRDDNALSTNPGLWNAIEEGLSSAHHLIVLVSPRAAASEYVDRGVRWWLDRKGQGSVLLVLDDGELHWDAALDGFTPDSTVPSLRDGFSEEPVPVPPGLDGVPRGYLMMPDGTTLLTGYYGDTSTTALLSARSFSLDALVAQACAAAGSPVTAAEWQRAVRDEPPERPAC